MTMLMTDTGAARHSIDEQYQWMVTVIDVFSRYLWTTFFCLGLPGNTLSFIISLKKENRRVSTCNFMTALAAADSLMVIVVAWSRILVISAQGASELHIQ
jgi:hypothetical protein